jgi:capsular polysaccharide export protein
MLLCKIREHKRILLLQGPYGSFFRRLGAWLRSYGAEVFRINLNGGDCLCYPGPNAFPYRGDLAGWDEFISGFLADNRIDALLLFGDTRPHHAAAIRIARTMKIPVYSMDEGYVRPNFITLEADGNNANSSLPRSGAFYRKLPDILTEISERQIKPNHLSYVISTIVYHVTEKLFIFRFPHYRYHKPYTICGEILAFLRSTFRRYYYNRREQDIFQRLTGELSKRYFLVPLQVYKDSQIVCHSGYGDVRDFIRDVMSSFALHAAPEHHLVLKHHPVDRGHRDYGELISSIAREYEMEGRCHYIHDLHLPTLLKNAIGVVTVNSTVGFSALFHGIPVKTMAPAIYDIEGLTYQGSINDFWGDPSPVDRELFWKFRTYVISTTQENLLFSGDELGIFFATDKKSSTLVYAQPQGVFRK